VHQLDIPIAAIDYTLALEAPFPRAIDETFYAYCWILKHPEYFGSTLERIIFISDSAGASISIGCTFKCIQNNIRPPDRLINAYGAMEVSLATYPSRLLSLFDPILPFSMVAKLFFAYVGRADDGKELMMFLNNTRILEDNHAKFPSNIFLSPITASDEILSKFPATSFMCPFLDPCLDENLEFAKKLKRLGIDVSVKILKNVFHSYLNFGHAEEECQKKTLTFIEEIQKSILS
jgi:hormone-sensitive lipase